MKLYRYIAPDGHPRLGIELDGLIHEATSLYQQAHERAPDAVFHADLAAIAAAPDVVTSAIPFWRGEGKVKPATAPDGRTTFAPADLKLLPPIPNPRKVICVGLNYREHALEQGKEPPAWPMLFSKFANAISGPTDPIPHPTVTTKLDYEAELCVVIGRGGKKIPRATALEHVFGYMAACDVSARDLQKSDGQWLRAKSCDGFAPTGPCVVTADEVGDPQKLRLQARLNGQVMQDSSTADMIFPVAELIEFITQAITLDPGDLILTGTPQGVGAHRKPPIFMKPGDVIEVEVEKVGTLRNQVVEG